MTTEKTAYPLRQRIFWRLEVIDDWLMDRVPERVWLAFPTAQLNRLACALLGHAPIPDQCDKPEHDYCAYCSKQMPGAAHKPEGGEPRG
jgi:hypothetical protein